MSRSADFTDPATPAPWYQKVPWYVSLPFVIGGWLVANFAGAVSQQWQIIGFSVGVILTLTGAAAFCLNVIWKVHKNSKRKLGIVIAFACVAVFVLIGAGYFRLSKKVGLFETQSGEAARAQQQDTLNLLASIPAAGIPPKSGFFNNNLHVVEMLPKPYKAGDQEQVLIAYRYDGQAPAKVWQYGYTIVGGPISQRAIIAGALVALEEKNWNDIIATQVNVQAVYGVVPPMSSHFITPPGPVLTADNVKGLKTGMGVVLMFMGYFRWTEGNDPTVYETDYCGLTQRNVNVIMECKNHNGPLQQNNHVSR